MYKYICTQIKQMRVDGDTLVATFELAHGVESSDSDNPPESYILTLKRGERSFAVGGEYSFDVHNFAPRKTVHLVFSEHDHIAYDSDRPFLNIFLVGAFSNKEAADSAVASCLRRERLHVFEVDLKSERTWKITLL